MTDSGRFYLWATLSFLIIGAGTGASPVWFFIQLYESGRLLLGLWFSVRLTSLVFGLFLPGTLLGWVVTAFALEAAQSGRSAQPRWLITYVGVNVALAILLGALFGSGVWLLSLLLGFRQPFFIVVAAHILILVPVSLVSAAAVGLFERRIRPTLVPRPRKTWATSFLAFLFLVSPFAMMTWNGARILALEELPDGGWVLTRRSAPFPGVGTDSGARITNYTYAKDWIVRVDIDLDGDGEPECIRRGTRLTVLENGATVETPSTSCKEALPTP